MLAVQIPCFQYSVHHILLLSLGGWPREMYFSALEGAIRTQFLESGLPMAIAKEMSESHWVLLVGWYYGHSPCLYPHFLLFTPWPLGPLLLNFSLNC